MEENVAKFQEKLKESGCPCERRKRTFLKFRKSMTVFQDMELDTEQMDKVFEYLEGHNGIDVLQMNHDSDDG